MAQDCGCGCGGTATRTAAFVRPRFFAGQLLTEDDLGLLVAYLTDKNRLHNRSLSGPGVIRGLEVACDPCGGGSVLVRPGHALDCAGNDIVLSCAERVDVAALVRELRISSLGVDCGHGCAEDGPRHYGLFVRYEEVAAEPVAPYATEEPCPSPGCVPSRVRESYRFLVRCGEVTDHRHNPGSQLLASIGDPAKAEQTRLRDQRLGHYVDAMFTAALAADRPVRFDAADAARYAASLAWLRTSGEGVPADPVAREMTAHVRALASAVARYDSYDRAGQDQLARDYPDLAGVSDARGVLRAACARLAATDPESVWPDPVRRSIARAVVTETGLRVAPERPDPDAPLEVRMLAQGTPLSYGLGVEFRADLSLVREWLLDRLDRATRLADCALRAEVARVTVPPLLPTPAEDGGPPTTVAELRQLAEAAAALTTALRRFLTDAACATLTPPATDCADTDVLLARLELADCDVVRVCAATREQVLPGGSVYGEWLPKLYRLRELAERVCCQPVPRHDKPTLPEDGPVPRPYPENLLGDWPRTGDLDQMLTLLLTPAPGETPPKAIHEQVYTAPSEVTDSLHELAVLRAQVADLTATVTGLRAQLSSAQEQVSEVAGQLPERLGARLADLESTSREPDTGSATSSTRRRSGRAAKPTSGEST
ncbi:hypothetical protein [Goodfellowiella coeruleoviolacea]|uniref:Uncharacterized protein n=1 Tax=Goodfellowiella coeruleoviolacea TaxID=334858 RepID=A0AAE3KE13_9PSEU|nr:hypothetical protein [Goodfellowiella coeruleoviolacea]MCP2163325.1 hypothetical protein [Goodfellowiella coeruleoviolacea]